LSLYWLALFQLDGTTEVTERFGNSSDEIMGGRRHVRADEKSIDVKSADPKNKNVKKRVFMKK